MPLLKCVGGPHDGREQFVNEGQRGVIVTYRNDADQATFSKEEYTVRECSFPQGSSVKMLAPRGWTDWRAYDHLLRNYKPA